MTDTPPPADRLPAPPARLDSFEAVFQSARLWTLRGIRGRRPLWMLAGVVLLAGIATLVGQLADSPMRETRFFHGAVANLLLGVVVPATALLMSTAFPWAEAQEGTLTYWHTLPIRRWTSALGRYLSSWFVGSLLLPLSAVALYLPLDLPAEVRGQSFLVATIAAVLLVYPAYLALFTLLCTTFRRGLVLGVIFMLVENSFAFFRGLAIQKLSLVYYSRSYVVETIPGDVGRLRERAERSMNLVAPDIASGTLAVVVFTSVAVLLLVASLAMIEVTEYRTKHNDAG